MPKWGEILQELAKTRTRKGISDFDGVRRKYLAELHNHTKRNVILYASGWVQRADAPVNVLSIVDEDIQSLMEVTSGLQGKELDLILHSPGGSAESAEALVSYLRSRFTHIRVIVPQQAMSAATMLACAADEIVMGKHSFLGPTDTQMLIRTPTGMRVVPAQAILDQFDKAQQECAKDSTKLAVWLPIINQYGPDLLVQCESVLDLSRELVQTWLREYMFQNTSGSAKKAKEIADWLANHKLFKSHNRHISRKDLQNKGLKIVELEEDQKLQDLSLSVFHATTHLFSNSPVRKIVENHTGRAFIKQQKQPPPPLLKKRLNNDHSIKKTH